MDVEPLSESGPVHEIGTPRRWLPILVRAVCWSVLALPVLVGLLMASLVAMEIFARRVPLQEFYGCYQSPYDTICFKPDGHFEQFAPDGRRHNGGVYSTDAGKAGGKGVMDVVASDFRRVCPSCDPRGSLTVYAFQHGDELLYGPTFTHDYQSESVRYTKTSARAKPAGGQR